MKSSKALLLIAVISLLFCTAGCIRPKIHLFGDRTSPLKEYTLEGKEKGKVLLIPIKGFISDTSRESILMHRHGTVQEVVSQLKKAEEDKEIKAVLLEVNSPGGSTTASDIIYNELLSFKEKTGVKVVAALMGMATSGGYYVSLPADFIVAHPTTITGSVGVIFLRPEVIGLMKKVGVEVDANKSGKHKDMGSPFRTMTPEEQLIFQNIVSDLGTRFTHLVAANRKLQPAALADISTARIYLAPEAMKNGLIDRIGYIQDAVRKAKELAGLPADSKLVVYRRTHYADDNVYNLSTTSWQNGDFAVSQQSIENAVSGFSDFYYLWPAALGQE